jgi:hypothetical protein
MRYLLGFFITIGLIILLVVLLVGGGGGSKVPKTSKPLYDYATSGAQAIMTIDGQINANSQHAKIRITVDHDNVTYEKIDGYDDNVTDMHTYSNTVEAYDAFLHALQHAGFTQGDTDKKLADYQGFCPLGQRYIFELKQDDRSLERFWATNCGGTKTYKGKLGTTIELFQLQVPGYDKLTNDVHLQ